MSIGLVIWGCSIGWMGWVVTVFMGFTFWVGVFRYPKGMRGERDRKSRSHPEMVDCGRRMVED